MTAVHREEEADNRRGGLEGKRSDGGSNKLRREGNGDGDRPGGAGNGDF